MDSNPNAVLMLADSRCRELQDEAARLGLLGRRTVTTPLHPRFQRRVAIWERQSSAPSNN